MRVAVKMRHDQEYRRIIVLSSPGVEVCGRTERAQSEAGELLTIGGSK